MHNAPTLIDAPHTAAAPARKRTRVIMSAAAAVLALSVAGGAAYWYHEYKKPSQASAADCELAQNIINGAQQISTGPVPDAEQWAKRTGDKRRKEMKDGYLGANVSVYEGWAVETAKQKAGRSAEVPTKQDVKDMQSQARGHCSDAGVTITMPPLGA